MAGSRSNTPGREDIFDVLDRMMLKIGTLERSIKAALGFARTAVVDVAYAVQTSDLLVAYTVLTATRVVTLPTASTSNTGQEFIVKDESGNASGGINITLTPSGGQTIDGAANKSITTAYGVIRVYSTGSAWMTW